MTAVKLMFHDAFEDSNVPIMIETTTIATTTQTHHPTPTTTSTMKRPPPQPPWTTIATMPRMPTMGFSMRILVILAFATLRAPTTTPTLCARQGYDGAIGFFGAVVNDTIGEFDILNNGCNVFYDGFNYGASSPSTTHTPAPHQQVFSFGNSRAGLCETNDFEYGLIAASPAATVTSMAADNPTLMERPPPEPPPLSPTPDVIPRIVLFIGILLEVILVDVHEILNKYELECELENVNVDL